MHIVIQAADWIAGAMILVALFLKFRNRWVWVWLGYWLACWTFTAINFYKGLPGQALMNLVAGLIAAWHVLFWKSDDS